MAALNVESTAQEKLDTAALTEVFVNSLDEPGVFRIVGSRDVAVMIDHDKQKRLLGCSDDTGCLAEIAGALGVDYVAQGSIGKVASTYVVSGRIVETKRARVTARGSVNVRDANHIVDALRQVAAKLLAGVEPTVGTARVNPMEKPPAAPAPQGGETTTGHAVSQGTSGLFFVAALVLGAEPFATTGRRGSVGGEAGVGFRLSGGLDAVASAVLAPSPGGRLSVTYPLVGAGVRLAAGGRFAAWPRASVLGGGPMVAVELPLGARFALSGTAAAELYSSQGRFSPLAVLVGAGVSFRPW
jgi:TolB-like protein